MIVGVSFDTVATKYTSGWFVSWVHSKVLLCLLTSQRVEQSTWRASVLLHFVNSRHKKRRKKKAEKERKKERKREFLSHGKKKRKKKKKDRNSCTFVLIFLIFFKCPGWARSSAVILTPCRPGMDVSWVVSGVGLTAVGIPLSVIRNVKLAVAWKYSQLS